MMSKKLGEWSVVIKGYLGDGEASQASDAALKKFIWSLPDVFPIAGFEMMLLILGPEEDLPAEVIDGLSRTDAEDIVKQLRNVQVTAEIMRTEEISGVHYRVADLMPDFESEELELTLSAAEELVITLTPLMAIHKIRNIRRSEPGKPGWEIEAYENHGHFFEDDLEQTLNAECARVTTLTKVLREVYPDRSFTISHDLGTGVTFWQTTEESPRQEEELVLPSPELGHTFCMSCQKMRIFAGIDDVDPRFPEARWGVCEICGCRVLAYSYRHLTFIGPGVSV